MFQQIDYSKLGALNSFEKKIIIHHLNSLSLGGTEKMVQILLSVIQSMDTNYDHYLAYKNDGDKSREPYFLKILGQSRMICYSTPQEFYNTVVKLKPHVIHRYSAGIPEWPFIPEIKQHTKHFISTSVFGDQDNTIPISKVIYVSQHLKNLTGFGNNDHHVVLRNSIEGPYSKEDLREELDIPKDAFVFGRIGRDDASIYDPINIQAYSRVENENTFFVIVNPSKLCLDDISNFNVKNFRTIERTTSEERLSKFYNTIDVLAHARKDGECNPANVWEAAAHAKPVISHYGEVYNGHLETIQNSGFVVLKNDVDEYAKLMKLFIDKKIDYSYFSNKAFELWKNVQPIKIAKQYLSILNSLN